MNRKQFAMATLFVAVLLTLTFTPTASQQAGTYDPWLDYDENGKIEIKDIAMIARAYGATGDPTKNVNVTNFPLDEQGNLRIAISEKPNSMTINISVNQPITVFQSQNTLLGEANVDGWRSAFVYIYWSTMPPSGLWYLLNFRTSAIPQAQVYNSGMEYQPPVGQILSLRSEVQGPILDIFVQASETFQSNVTVSLYLRR